MCLCWWFYSIPLIHILAPISRLNLKTLVEFITTVKGNRFAGFPTGSVSSQSHSIIYRHIYRVLIARPPLGGDHLHYTQRDADEKVNQRNRSSLETDAIDRKCPMRNVDSSQTVVDSHIWSGSVTIFPLILLHFFNTVFLIFLAGINGHRDERVSEAAIVIYSAHKSRPLCPTRGKTVLLLVRQRESVNSKTHLDRDLWTWAPLHIFLLLFFSFCFLPLLPFIFSFAHTLCLRLHPSLRNQFFFLFISVFQGNLSTCLIPQTFLLSNPQMEAMAISIYLYGV